MISCSGYHWILPVNDSSSYDMILYTGGRRICSCGSFQPGHTPSCAGQVSQLASVPDRVHKMIPVSHGDRQRIVGLMITMLTCV